MTSPGGLFSVLRSVATIWPAWEPASGTPEPPGHQITAIWDTGATNSVITQSIVDACGLIPTSMTTVEGIFGPVQAETYLVNVGLPNMVRFIGLRVTKLTLNSADMLIGMDVINRGDFAVTNLGGTSKFSFRMPSTTHIDFVVEHNKQAQAERFAHGGTPRARNHPRPGGKKKKN